MKRGGFVMKMRKNTYLKNENDLQLFITYLKHGYSLQETIIYFPNIAKKLDESFIKGESFEAIIYECLPKYLQNDFKLFLKVLPLELAIEAAMKRKSIHRILLKDFRNKCAYPLFLFIFAFSLLQLFSRIVVPLMLSSFTMIDTNHMIYFVYGMDILCTLILFVSFIMMMICILCINANIRKFIILKGAKHIKIIRVYISLMLATYMIPFVSKGLSTIDIFLHMQECESLWMKYIASKIHEYLLEGHSYQNVYRLMNCFDNDWQQCVQRGIALANLEAMIQFYLDLAQKKLINAMRKLTIVIQVSAYLFIAMLVLFVFQIMLLPLSILETI